MCQEAAQLRRYLPAQLVAAEDQPFKVGEADQLRRQLPAQLVAAEDQLYNAPVVVGGDAPPFAEGASLSQLLSYQFSPSVAL